MRHIVALLALSVALAAPEARAQITISVEPTETRAPSAGGSFNVEVHFKDYADLYAYRVELFYNPAALTHTALTKGPIFGSAGDFFLTAGSNAAQGRILVDHTILGPLEGVNGADAVAFTVAFEATAAGGSDLFYGDVRVRDSDNVNIAFTLEEGLATVVSPLPNASASLRFAASTSSAAYADLGSTGVAIQTTASGTGGTVTGMRYDAVPPGGAGSSFTDPDGSLSSLAVVDGYWEVTSSLSGAYNADLAFDYTAFAGPANPADYRVARRSLAGGGGDSWTLVPIAETSVNVTDGEVRVDGAVGTYGSGQYALVYEQPSVAMTGTEGWRMLGMPGEGQTYDAYLGPLWTQGFTDADAVPTDPFFCNAFSYDPLWVDEGAPDYNGDGLVSARDGWRCLTAQSAAFGRGQAVMVYVFSDDNRDGTPEGFPKTVLLPTPVGSAPFTFGGLTYSNAAAIADTEEGFNFLGNPFGVSFDWDVLADGVDYSDINGTAYVYDPNYNGGDYRTRNAGTGDLAEGIVPAAQGFFIQATGASPALEIPAGAIGGNEPYLGRTGALRALRALRFELRDPSSGDPVAAAFVRFDEGAEPTFDRLDSQRLAPLRWPYVSLFSLPLEGVDTNDDGVDEYPPVVQNALPLPTGVPTEIPLVVEAAGQDGESVPLRLTWEGTEGLPATWRLDLRDEATGAIVELRPGGTYDFDVAPSAAARATAARHSVPGALHVVEATSRFVLSVTDSGSVANEDGAEAGGLHLSAAPNPTAGRATVNYRLPESGPVRLAVFDLLGREVLVLRDHTEVAGSHSVALEAAGLPGGVYLLRLTTPSEVLTTKIAVTR